MQKHIGGAGVVVAARIPLSKPIPGHTGEITEIALREPTVGDWFECGEMSRTTVINPAQFGGAQAVEIKVDEKAVAAWFQRLSGLPMATLAKMNMKDARAVFGEIRRLVGELDSGNSVTPPTSSG